MDAVITLFLVFTLVITGSLLLIFISGTFIKRSQSKLESYRKEIDTFNAQRELQYANDIEPILVQAHQTLCHNFQLPDHCLTVDILNVNSEKELQFLQQQLPEQWCAWPVPCSCWDKDNILDILETFESSASKARRSPNLYATLETVQDQIRHISIPLDTIHYYKTKGEIIRSQRTIVPENASYSGISVNGISLGEVKTSPALTVPKIVDMRYIVLYYQVHDKNELQSLYFGYDSLDALIRIIPQHEQHPITYEN